MEYTKNEVINLTIEDIGVDGEGIGKIDGYTFFVKDAVIGDVIEAKVMKAKKNYAYAKLIKVIEPSSKRVEPKCAFHKQCGGCQIQAMDYRAQLDFKQKKVRNHFTRIGGFEDAFIDSIMEPVVGMECPWHYRNKAQFPVGKDKEGNLITGFYAGRTHDIIANTDCALGVMENKEILETILQVMNDNYVTSYDEETGKGLVRHVLIRKGFTSGEIMVCLVINETKLPHEQAFVNALKNMTGMSSIYININTQKTNVILGRESRVLWGADVIHDVIHPRTLEEINSGKDAISKDRDGITFAISPLSFYQVNPVQTEKLYSLALEYASLTGKETVWDLYCGIGTISLFMAQRAKKVYGVEIVPEAIADAKKNAKNNNITNAEFFVGKAEEVLPEFYKKASADEDMLHPDVICVDPPRKGCDEACLQTMVQMAPSRIVYVSCDSATLARDAKYLCEHGYELEKIRPVDQFGHTVHVETVCLLSKLHEAKHHINIKVDMDELDLTSAEAKATYKEIEEWVQEHYGFHVTNLNIAQVKQKHGIIERENYNKPKSENSRQPGCPEEKVKAIEEALKFFQMI